MRIPRARIRLVNNHPSLLLDLQPAPILAPPVIIDQEQRLVDGYRRYQLCGGDEIEAVEMEVTDWFEAAMAFNSRTRPWDETDSFLWTRLARSLGRPDPPLAPRFAPELFQAGPLLLRLLAERRLLPRQVVLILNLPGSRQEFFTRALSEWVQLNANETANFIDLTSDLQNILRKSSPAEVFEVPELAEVVKNQEFSSKQRGEKLLKRLRILRYPTYQRQAELFTFYLARLHLAPEIRTNRTLFLERGTMEMTISATSLQDFRRLVRQVHDSLGSDAWEKIWEE